METDSFHIDQYKMLRDEIMQHMREVDRTWSWGVIAAGAVYAWLILHWGAKIPTLAWFISPGVILFCGIRVLVITLRMTSIAGYLRRIEARFFSEDSDLPGWECFLEKDIGHYSGLSPANTAIAFWIFMLLTSAFTSYILWQGIQK